MRRVPQTMSSNEDGEPRRRLVIGDLVGAGGWADVSTATLEWLGSLLADEGVDLMDATDAQLERGTPVYVRVDADVVEVQRRMAQRHIRRLPVVADGHLVGLIDLLELAQSEAVMEAANGQPPGGGG
jgi:CBS domain-containing protein